MMFAKSRPGGFSLAWKTGELSLSFAFQEIKSSRLY